MAQLKIYYNSSVQPGDVTAFYPFSDTQLQAVQTAAKNSSSALATLLAANPIVSSTIGDDGHLRYVLYDGTQVDLGKVVDSTLGTAVVNALQAGAKGDASNDDGPVLQSIIQALSDAGGGTLLLPPGTYYTSVALGNTTDYTRHVAIRGLAPRGVRWTWGDGSLDPNGKPWVGGAYLKATADVPVFTGLWEDCFFQWLAVDADMRGESCFHGHLSKTVIDQCEFLGYSNAGLWLNGGDYTDDLGYLNRIMHCNIADTGEETGIGIKLEYRFIDSWIQGNNIEAPDADIEINSGGPFRILDNHLNGNRSPLNNIRFNGGVRECLIQGNILEGSREEAVKYVAPTYTDTPERSSVVINGNIIRQSGQAKSGKPIIGIYGAVAAHTAFRTMGWIVSANTIATDYTDTARNVVKATATQDLSIIGNYWRTAHDATTSPVNATTANSCSGVEVLGNHGDNATV